MNTVDLLRYRTVDIINVSPSVCRLIRDKAVKNRYGDVSSYERIEKEGVKVRLATMESKRTQDMVINHSVTKRLYSLTAEATEDIRVGDVLKISNNGKDEVIYRVLEVNCYYYGEQVEENCFKISGIAERVC